MCCFESQCRVFWEFFCLSAIEDVPKGFRQNTVCGFVLQLFYIHKSLVARHSVGMLGSYLVSLAAVIRDTKENHRCQNCCRGSFNSCPLSRALDMYICTYTSQAALLCAALAVNREKEPVTVPRKTDPFTHSLSLTHSLTLSLQPGLAWSWPGLASLNRSYVSSRPSPPLLKAVLNGVFQFPLLHTHTHTQGKGIGMHRKEKNRDGRSTCQLIARFVSFAQ